MTSETKFPSASHAGGTLGQEHPPFTELFEAYLTAFNSHSLSDTLAHLSPDITITYLSRPLSRTQAEIEKAYTDHWAECKVPIVVQEIEKFGEGVRCTLLDENRGSFFRVVYWYAMDGNGEWRHIKHEILEEKKIGTEPGEVQVSTGSERSLGC